MAKKIKIVDYEKELLKKQETKIENKKKDKLKICSLIINGVFGICLIVILTMYLYLKTNSVSKDKYDSTLSRINYLESDLNSKNRKISSLESDSNNYKNLLNGKTYYYVKDKLEFMDENIVFEIKGFGNYYYSYDCMMDKVNGYYEYWAYNKEAAIDEGLRSGGC